MKRKTATDTAEGQRRPRWEIEREQAQLREKQRDQAIRRLLEQFDAGTRRGFLLKIKVRHHAHQQWSTTVLPMEIMPRREPVTEFHEHESGPERLVYFAVATAGITMATAVINLITAIINSRTARRKVDDGYPPDWPDRPAELTLIGRDSLGRLFESQILRIAAGVKLTRKKVEKLLTDEIKKRLLEMKTRLCPPAGSSKKNARKISAKGGLAGRRHR